MDNKHTSKEELAQDLNMSVSTLYRLIKAAGIPYNGKLLSPSERAYIVQRLDEHKFSKTFGRPDENGNNSPARQNKFLADTD